MNIRKMAIITAIREAERRLGEGSEFTCEKAIEILEEDQDGPVAVEVLRVYFGLYAHNLALR
jgi:hypothetical protein